MLMSQKIKLLIDQFHERIERGDNGVQCSRNEISHQLALEVENSQPSYRLKYGNSHKKYN